MRRPLTSLVLGTWAILPPYLGRRLGVPRSAEVIDHVVPAILVIVVSLLAIAGVTRLSTADTPLAAVVLAAGVWMTATHLSLIGQAVRHEAPRLTVLHHAAPGAVLLVLGAWWLASSWPADGQRRPPA